MKRKIQMQYEDLQITLGYSSTYRHYRVSVEREPIGWVVPHINAAYTDQGEPLGTFKSLEKAAEAVAEHYVYFR